MSTLYRWGWG